VEVGDGEDLDALYARICAAIGQPGPVAVVNRRPICPGIEAVEGTVHGHDALATRYAVPHLRARGQQAAATLLEAAPRHPVPHTTRGPTQKARHVFDQTVVEILGRLDAEERRARVICVDSDLGESCGLFRIGRAYPEIYVTGGIMERANFSTAAGFGTSPGKQGIFGTYSVFLEMCISEITMARLNRANVLCNLSHAGVDELADNTCHFGVNNFFADNGLDDGHPTWLFYPADGHQMRAVVEHVFDLPGLRFVFSSRAAVPDLLDENGELRFAGGYRFEIGQDDLLREGRDGYILSYGDSLYRCLNAIQQLRAEHVSVGLINKSTLNVPDEASLARLGRAPFVLVVESQIHRTGLGIRVGTWLLERGFCPRYAHLGTHRAGCGGLAEQVPHQDLDEAGIVTAVRRLHALRDKPPGTRVATRSALPALPGRGDQE
jgi:transketolase C-terminal domain/subunit